VKENKWKHAADLINILREFGRKLTEVDPTQTISGNIVRRALKIVRDDYASIHANAEPQQLSLLPHTVDDYRTEYKDLSEFIVDSLDELEREVEGSSDNIRSQSEQHINDNEVILTVGKSRTVEAFLKKAHQKRVFQVLVVELAPKFKGHEMAKNLADAGIFTRLIHDSAVFAFMSRVHKVIIGTHSVMADGGLKAPCGVLTVAMAAKHYSVPLIVCAPTYKLTPQFMCSEDQPGFNRLESPQDVYDFADGDFDEAEVLNPMYDYVPPELVPLLVFNSGGNCPTYVYRLLSELYHPDDYDLTKEID